MKAIAGDLMRGLEQLHPPVVPKFRGPTSHQVIEQAESHLGVALDDELIQFLLCVDGQESEGYGFLGDPIVPMFRFGSEPGHFSGYGWLLGIERIVEFTLLYRKLCTENEEELYECHGPARFHGDYIQLMGSDNATGIAIDLCPLHGGVVGQIVAVNDQPNHVAVLAPSFGEFLQSIVDGYANDRFQHVEGVWSER